MTVAVRVRTDETVTTEEEAARDEEVATDEERAVDEAALETTDEEEGAEVDDTSRVKKRLDATLMGVPDVEREDVNDVLAAVVDAFTAA